MQASEIDALHADAIFAEINAARVSTKLVSTATASCMGTTWVIVSRGRNRSNAKLLSWLERAELRRMAPRRNPLRPDQRHYVLEPATTISGLVERDVTAVLAVLYGARSIDVWRQFVKASLDGEHEGSAIDREAIVTVCQSMLRLDLDLEQALNKAMNWPSARATRSACQKLFQLTIELLSDADYKSEKWLVQKWSDVTSYRQKIESHRLPGRILQDFDDLMARVEDEWWPASPPGGEEDSHAGDLEQQAVWDEDLSGFLRNEDGAAGRPGRTMDADEGTDETDE